MTDGSYSCYLLCCQQLWLRLLVRTVHCWISLARIVYCSWTDNMKGGGGWQRGMNTRFIPHKNISLNTFTDLQTARPLLLRQHFMSHSLPVQFCHWDTVWIRITIHINDQLIAAALISVTRCSLMRMVIWTLMFLCCHRITAAVGVRFAAIFYTRTIQVAGL